MKQYLQMLVILGISLTLFAACAVATSAPSTNNDQPSGSAQRGDAVLKQPDGNANAAAQEGEMANQAKQAPDKIDKSQFKLAREISSETWVNSEKLNWSDLRGKVVVVNFWTFACYNCKNTLPYIKSWDEKYRAQGLVVLGVHSPELSFEKDVDNVRKAVNEYGIKYPIPIDGDFSNWTRYNVRAWPTWFIVDKEGYIRYSHIGEGDYAGSERVIQQLLAE